jgi:hypothetical protein
MGKAETASRNKTALALRIAVKRTGRTSGSFVLGLLAICSGLASCGRLIPVFAQNAAHYRFHSGVALNDLTVSPGEVRGSDRKDICNKPAGWTDEFRATTDKMKEEVYAEYGVDKHKFNRALFCKAGVVCDTDEEWAKKNKGHKVPLPLYEIDHIVSLQLDGADTIANLMPQPYYAHPGAHEKDAVENWLRKQVCTGKMELPDAQRAIATDWPAVYLKMNELKPGQGGAD